ncbi:histone-like nucleoid-structuring protein Lsr2 [Pseudarthrobacter sp. NamE5]|nr:histone-like nucleoid-structuring protein Lsr2 [Pseudarthrobacter sp. NamE5]
MAVVVLEDDLDGSEAVETVQFAVDGADYEIDLSGPIRTNFAKR